MRDYANGPEDAFCKLAESNGWAATKRGWPDFLCFKDGQLICVEVKPRLADGSRLKLLKPTQVQVMNALTDAGIKCFVSDGTRLIPFKKNCRHYI